MLTDPVEIEIVSRAKQKNVRDPKRSRAHFERIFEDFLSDITFENSTVIDMGPGQFDFGVLAAERGATVIAVDRDPAVVELGRHKGFEVIEGDLKAFGPDMVGRPLDGVFCKFSINAFWFRDAEKVSAHVDATVATLVPGGWGWIAPWNGVPRKRELHESEVRRFIEIQAETFVSHGFKPISLTEDQSRYYGVHGATANCIVFFRGQA